MWLAGKNIATADVLSRAPINSSAEGLSEKDIDLYADSVMASLPATEMRLKEIWEHQDKDFIRQQLSTVRKVGQVSSRLTKLSSLTWLSQGPFVCMMGSY